MKQKGFLINAIQQKITGFLSGAGIITSNDSIHSAIQKLDGNINVATTGPKYLRGNATTPNSVRISISGTDVNLQKTIDGITWNDIVTIGGPV